MIRSPPGKCNPSRCLTILLITFDFFAPKFGKLLKSSWWTWWRLFQKQTVCTRYEIFIFNPLLLLLFFLLSFFTRWKNCLVLYYSEHLCIASGSHIYFVWDLKTNKTTRLQNICSFLYSNILTTLKWPWNFKRKQIHICDVQLQYQNILIWHYYGNYILSIDA